MRVWPVLLLLFLLPSASAINMDAAPWSPDLTLLYIDSDDAANGDAEVTGFLNTAKDDGDDAALGPSGSCSTHTGNDVDFTLVAPSQDIDRLYTFPLMPAQAGTALIKGPVQASLYVGAGSCYGEVDLTARLVAAGTVVAEGGVTKHRYNDATGLYPLASFELEVLQPEFAADDMRLEIQIKGKYGGMVFIGIGSARGLSSIDVPLVSFTQTVEPTGTEYVQDLVGRELFIEANGSSDTHVYNWTNGEPFVLLQNVTVLGGNATFQVLDANGTMLLERTWDANVTDRVEAAWIGDLQMRVALNNFTGSIRVEAALPSTAELPDDVDEEAPIDPGNETDVDGPDAAGKESPGLGVVAAPALLAIALLRRRP